MWRGPQNVRGSLKKHKSMCCNMDLWWVMSSTTAARIRLKTRQLDAAPSEKCRGRFTPMRFPNWGTRYLDLTLFEATRLLKQHPHVGDQMNAAAAALIATTMQYKDGQIHAAPSPLGFRCGTCGAKMGSMKSARLHCRYGQTPLAVRARGQ